MLDKTIPIWPPLYEQMVVMDKIKQIKTLDSIAESMQTPRPKTYTIQEAQQLPLLHRKQGLVLKRNNSSCNEHVILPPLKSDLASNISQPDTTKELGVYGTWFAQDYVASLRTTGELRVFMVDGKTAEVMLGTTFSDNSQGLTIEVLKSPPLLSKLHK